MNRYKILDNPNYAGFTTWFYCPKCFNRFNFTNGILYKQLYGDDCPMCKTKLVQSVEDVVAVKVING